MVCKINYCSEFPGIPDKAGRKTRRRRRTQAITKRYAFHANAINIKNAVITKMSERDLLYVCDLYNQINTNL